jgi:hypothetical protein
LFAKKTKKLSRNGNYCRDCEEKGCSGEYFQSRGEGDVKSLLEKGYKWA